MSSVGVKYFTVSGVDLKITVSNVGLVFEIYKTKFQDYRLGIILNVRCQAFFPVTVSCQMKSVGNVGCWNNPFHGPL